LQRSHDERCPSGSGWGSARSRALVRAFENELVGCGFGLSDPWPVKPRLVLSTRWKGLRPRPPWRTALPVLGAGSSAGEASAMLLTKPGDCERAQRASARWPALSHTVRDQAIGGRARGSSWLQKSTSGAWSRPKGQGSSSLAPRSRGRAQRAKGRRKPGRGGESRQHASSDTGGGLLVIPHARRASVRTCSGEGALGDGRRPGAVRGVVFDETAVRPSRATRGDGDAAAMPGPPRAQEDVRGRVASPSGGREHRRREVRRRGAADRGSARTASNPTCERTGPRPLRDHVMVAATAEAGGSPSSEAPPGWLIRQAVR